MGTLRARHYGETVEKLKADPVLRGMADEIRDGIVAGEIDPDIDFGEHGPMVSALEEYKRRGGAVRTHIGGPAEALAELLKEDA